MGASSHPDPSTLIASLIPGTHPPRPRRRQAVALQLEAYNKVAVVLHAQPP